MHEQNFEKQVQQKMEELSLTPSAPVWQKVEGQIRTKKERRRLLLWLLPLLMVVGGTWWLLSGTGDVRTSAATNSVTQAKPAPATEHPVRQTTPSVPTDNTEDHLLTKAETEQRPSTGTSPSTFPAAPATVYPKPRQAAPALVAEQETAFVSRQEEAMTTKKDRQSEKSGQAEETANTQKDIITQQKEILTQDVAISKERSVTQEPATVPLSKTDTAAILKPVDTAREQEAVRPVVSSPTPAADSPLVAAPAPVPTKKTNKWKWTIHAEAGINAVRSNLFEQAPTAQEAFISPALSGSGNFGTYKPSPIESGYAFSAGVSTSRLLGHRTRILAGLQYNYYSTQMEVGQAVQSSTTLSYSNRSIFVDNYYLPGQHNSYRNEYHFIQLPLGVEYQAFRQLPLQLQAGVTLARMVSTNALVWDYNARLYYPNSSVFNKTQLHLFTNLTYTLWKGKTRALNVGPYMQYGLTELQKEDADKNRLFSAGLRTHLSF